MRPYTSIGEAGPANRYSPACSFNDGWMARNASNSQACSMTPASASIRAIERVEAPLGISMKTSRWKAANGWLRKYAIATAAGMATINSAASAFRSRTRSTTPAQKIQIALQQNHGRKLIHRAGALLDADSARAQDAGRLHGGQPLIPQLHFLAGVAAHQIAELPGQFR